VRLIEIAYSLAKKEIGVKELDGDLNSPRILTYHSYVKGEFTSDSIPWCSSFVNYCMQVAGGMGTKSAMARSWLAWGKKISTPHEGCVVVFARGTDGISGHVGFFVKESKTNIWVLGGNQEDAVNISAYSKSKFLGYRTSKD